MPDYDETAARRWLDQRGFPLYAAFAVRDLPEEVRGSFRAAGLAVDDFSSAILLGNAGPDFWAVLDAHHPGGDDPVDEYSRKTALAFAAEWLGDSAAQCLYPLGEVSPPLQVFGALAGWQHPSPLGMGIHPRWGLWHAYRALLLTHIEVPPRREPASASPCLGCAAPCISGCPAEALSRSDWPAIRDCLDYRVSADSACAERCIARLACPIAADQRYPLAQIRHHYRDPAGTLRRYFGVG